MDFPIEDVLVALGIVGGIGAAIYIFVKRKKIFRKKNKGKKLYNESSKYHADSTPAEFQEKSKNEIEKFKRDVNAPVPPVKTKKTKQNPKKDNKEE